MKRFFTLFAASAVALSGLAAVPVQKAQKQVSLSGLESQTSMRAPSRSYEAPQMSFTANLATFEYYGDWKKNGKGFYYLYLSNCGRNDNMPANPGQFVRVFLCSTLSASSSDPKLPAGEYKFADAYGDFTFTNSYTAYLDAFHDPANPTGELIGWKFVPEGGTIKVAEKDGVYTIDLTFNSTYTPTGGTEQAVTCTAHYEGRVPVVPKYPSLGDKDIEVVAPNITGNYDTKKGILSLVHYDVPLDKDGFIIGEGQLLNSMFNIDPKADPYKALPGEYTWVDYWEYATGWVPGTFVGGSWYDLGGGMGIPMGTGLSHYNSTGDQDGYGPSAKGSKVSVTLDEYDVAATKAIYTFNFDLIRPDGYKIAFKWTGNLAGGVIQDLPAMAGVESVEADQVAISAGNGCINAPEDAQVFTTTGTQCGKTQLAPGLYIVKHGSKAVKVLVK